MDVNSYEQNGRPIMRLLMLTLTLSSMSAMMFTIVLPQLSREFQLSIGQVSWLTSAYTLIYAFGTVTYGKLTDRFQLKHVLTFGLLLFAAGSLLGLTSHSFAAALLGRCLQSAGAAAIPAAAVLIPVRYFAPERRGAAMGMSAVGLALGGALGPAVASLIVGFANWRWLFAVPLLLLFTLPFYRKYLAEEEREKTRGTFDWIGGLLLACAVSLLLFGVTNRSWETALGGLPALMFFIARIRSAKDPFIRPDLFRNRRYTLHLVLAFLINGACSSLFFLTPLLLSDVHRLPANWIGYAMVPAAAASAVFGRKGGRLADVKGNPYLFLIAAGSLLTCFLLLSTFTASSPVWITLFLMLGNVGQSFMLIAMSNSVSRTLPKEQVGVGLGLFSMLNFIAQGAAAGVYSLAVDLGSAVRWNPAFPFAGVEGYAFSNIYLVLAAVHLGVVLFYVFGFAETREPVRAES